MRKYINLLFIVLIIVGFTAGCTPSSNKDKIEFNKSAVAWYDDILKSISRGELEKADKKYLSLRSEHTNSSLIAPAMLILALAHMDNDEYLLADFYLGEYIKRYGNGPKGLYAKFLKIKAKFLSIRDINKDQKMVMSALSDAKIFYNTYKNSKYAPLVQTMIVRLEMSQYLLNEDIASLYDRIHKPTAAKLYRDKNKKFIYSPAQIKAPKNGFISAINPF